MYKRHTNATTNVTDEAVHVRYASNTYQRGNLGRQGGFEGAKRVASDRRRRYSAQQNSPRESFGCGCGVRTHSNLPADLKLPTQAAQPPRFELHCTRAHGHGHPVQEVYDINRDFDAKAQSNNAHCHLWSCQSTYPMRRSSGKPAAECADGRDTCCNCKNVSARAFMKQCCMPQFLQTWKPPISTIVGGTNLQEQFRH